CAVRQRPEALARLVVGEPSGACAAGAHRASVRDDEDGLALMPRCKLDDGRDHPGTHLLVALAAVPRLQAAVPPLEGERVALLDLAPKPSRPIADVDLAEPRVGRHREPEPRCDDLGGLARTREI